MGDRVSLLRLGWTGESRSSYCRHGRERRDENGIRCSDELVEAMDLCNDFLNDAKVKAPHACVIDVGIIEGRGWAVIESNAAWSSGIYGYDGAAVLPVPRSACRLKV